MKTMLIFICLLFDLAVSQAQTQFTKRIPIPAAGQTITIDSPAMPSTIYIYSDTAVNLGANTFTVTYDQLPPYGQAPWTVILDLHNVTFNGTGTNITIFGKHPTVDWPKSDSIVFTNRVLAPGILQQNYVSPNYQFSTVNNKVVFDSLATFNAGLTTDTPVIINKTLSTSTATVYPVAQDSATGKIVTKCYQSCGDTNWAWHIDGNTGLGGLHRFLGTTDTAALNFRVNGKFSGNIDMNLQNTSLGYEALYSNTSGNNNAAFGFGALNLNTTGGSNTAIGFQALASELSGSNNTAIGVSAGNNTPTTGSGNTLIGATAELNSGTVTEATILGYAATADNYGIALGEHASAAVSQLGIAASVNQIYFPGHATGLHWMFVDTTGAGIFVPMPIDSITLPLIKVNYLTSVTGDSVAVTAQTTVQENPGGTLANLTFILPASPVNGQVIHFVTTQILTAIHWSIRLETGNTTPLLPSSATAGQAWAIQYSSSASQWLPYQ